MHKIERAAEEIGLPGPRAARERLQPQIDDQHRTDEQGAERDLEISGSGRIEGRAVIPPASEQHPEQHEGDDIGQLKEDFPQQAHVLIAAKRKNATDLVRPCVSKALLPLEEHVRDAEIDLWKKGKQTQQSPPETEEGNEGIACRAWP